MNQQTEQAQIFIQLLVGSGLVSRSEFADYKLLAKDLNMPLIQAIMTSGSIRKEYLNIAAEALMLVQQKKISPDLAIRALRIAFKKSIGFSEAINKAKNLHRTTRTIAIPSNELSNLLISSKILTREQIGSLLVKSHNSSIMIGQLMIIDGVLSVLELLSVLTALRSVREERIRLDDAILGLECAYKKKVTLEQALFELGKFEVQENCSLFLGELFVMANLLTLAEYTECLEIEMFKKKDYEVILLERGLVIEQTLRAAQHLLESIKNGILWPVEAREILEEVARKKKKLHPSIYDTVERREEGKVYRLGDLLIDSGFCSREELEEVVRANTSSAVKVGSALIRANLVSEQYLYSGLRLQTALRQGYIRRKAAIELLKYVKESGKSLDEACIDVEVFIPTRTQWTWI